MQYKDNDLDNIVDATEHMQERIESYASQLMIQLKKGVLSYCVLMACEQSSYSSEVIGKLNLSELSVAEGTIYPLLARLQQDGLLQSEWSESDKGPPRKYYAITDYGRAVRKVMARQIKQVNKAINNLEREMK
jgi:PadR family transcriptional regulator PadR